MGIFNKTTFLASSVSQPNSTVVIPLPPKLYEGVVLEVDVRNGEKEGKEWAALVVKFELFDEEVKAQLKRDRLMITYDFYIDLTEMGTISTEENKNVSLGKLRKAAGMNDGDFCPMQLVGVRMLVNVYNEPVKDSPDGDIRAKVRGVAALSSAV